MKSESNEQISVMLVDDHAIWRDGLRAILEGTEFQVIAEAASGHEAIEVARELKVKATSPRLILLDIRMAGGDGLDALNHLKATLPQAAVLMLTTYDNPTYMARAVAGGAAGYLLKGCKRLELLTALRAVANGELLLSRDDLTRSLRGLVEAATDAEELIQPLSEREVEVLRLLATGLNNREIGELLFISENTVKTHVVHILNKLGVSDRVQAAVWAARHGMATT